MKYISIYFICFSLFCHSQIDSTETWKKKPIIEFNGFIDVFYVFDFNKPTTNSRQNFFFNHNRHNEFNLNLGLIKLNVNHKKYRANFALHAGTYVNDNYANEPQILKNINEANIGLSLSQKNKLWLDIGILSSHLGFESAISIENPTLTRSISAESSPYFSTGAKITYKPNENWEVSGLILNGWQRIQRLQGNSLPSFGSQINLYPNQKVKINWSTFIGTDDPDSTRRMRYFSNIYGIFHLSEKFELITGFDFGLQQDTKKSVSYNYWLTPVFIAQFSFTEKWKTSIRAEYYEDRSGVIIPTTTPSGFVTTGISFNIDYSPIEQIICRLEGRWLNSKDKIFQAKKTPTNDNVFIGTSIAIKFSEILTK